MTESMISVIVPVYNVEKYLRMCMDSIVNQTYSNLEIICVNDGSKDSSRSILKEYEEKDKRIRVIDKKNGGLSDARNTGLQYVHGEYIMFVDSDDWLEVTACEKSLKIAKEYQVDVVMWPYMREFGHVSLQKNIFDHDIFFDHKQTHEKIYRRFFGLYEEELAHPENADAIVTVWGKLYRSDLILQNDVQFIDTKIIGTEDALFNVQLFKYVETCYYTNDFLAHYRKDNSGSLTNAYKRDLILQWKTLFRLMEEELIDNQLEQNFFQSLDNRISLSLIGLGLNVLTHDVGIKYKLDELSTLLNDETIRKALKKFKLNFLPIHWKIFFYSAKIRATLAIYFLLLVMNRLRSK